MNIFLTGATGMIGRRVVADLVAHGHTLTCLVRSIPRAEKLDELRGANFIEGDLIDPSSLNDRIHGFDVVIHLAVLGHLNEAACDESEFLRVNVDGLKHLLDACVVSPPKRIIVTSTSAAIGYVNAPTIDETVSPNPQTPYGRSKLQAEQLMRRYISDVELPIVILRFTHVYGPGDTRDLLKIIRWIRQGIFPQIGIRPNYYPALYIDDAVYAIRLALKRGQPGTLYHVTDGDPHDTRKIRKLVRDALGLPRLPFPVLPRQLTLWTAMGAERLLGRLGKGSPIPVRSIRNLSSGRRFSIDKARNELGFEPQVSLEEGIRRTIQWYKAEGLL